MAAKNEPKIEQVSSVNLPPKSGLFVLQDARQVDSHWRSGTDAMSGKWAIDMTGPRAEFHAKRVSQQDATLLPDGTTWRLIVNDSKTAAYQAQAIRILAKRNGEDCVVHHHALHASAESARDATRVDGFGLVQSAEAQMVAVHAPNGVRVDVVERDASGRVIAVTVRAS